MTLVGAALRLFFAGTTACSSELLGFFGAVTMIEKRLSMTELAVTPYASWRGKTLTCEAAMCSSCIRSCSLLVLRAREAKSSQVGCRVNLLASRTSVMTALHTASFCVSSIAPCLPLYSNGMLLLTSHASLLALVTDHPPTASK